MVRKNGEIKNTLKKSCIAYISSFFFKFISYNYNEIENLFTNVTNWLLFLKLYINIYLNKEWRLITLIRTGYSSWRRCMTLVHSSSANRICIITLHVYASWISADSTRLIFFYISLRYWPWESREGEKVLK